MNVEAKSRSIRVRALAPPDRLRWAELWDGYLEFYRVSIADEVTRSTWERLLDPAVDVHGLGAVQPDGRLVGFVHYLFHPVTWSIPHRCYLEDLFVDPDARRLGAGEALIEAVYVAADARNADQVYWVTEETNQTARRLYDRVATRTPFIKYQR